MVLQPAEQRFNHALALHNAGRVADALAIYLELSRSLPANAVLAAQTGTAYLQLGQPAASLGFFEQSFRLNDRQPAIHLNYGNALLQLGRLDQALKHFDRVTRLNPKAAEGYCNKASVLFQQRQFDRVVACCDQAIQRGVRDAVIYSLKGSAFSESGRYAQAIKAYDAALILSPDYIDAWLNRSRAHKECKAHEAALADARRAVELRPDVAIAFFNLGWVLMDQQQFLPAREAYERAYAMGLRWVELACNLGLVCLELEDYPAAERFLSEALQMDPCKPEIYLNLGKLHQAESRYPEAIAAYQKALARKADYAEAMNNLGVVFRLINQPAESLVWLDRALLVRTDYAEALSNKGIVLQDMQCLTEAMACFDEAIRQSPAQAELYWNRAFLKLLCGNFSEGWAEFEYRKQVKDHLKDIREFVEQKPLWLGEADTGLTGQVLLLHAEQGLGDTLQFCRYVPHVQALGATVTLEVQPPLVSLLQGQFPGVTVIAHNQPLPAFDLHCPLMSLPLAFRTELGTIPADIPYLQARPERIAAWGERLGPRQRPRIGVVWSGNPAHKNDHNRSLRLSQLEDLLQLPYDWHILQKDIQPEDQDTMHRLPQLQDHRTELTDFDATAGLLSHMDLLISVDTSVAHLAGAMGKPVWLLLPYMPDYRWLLDRTDSPWYPSFTLYRQPAIGDWASVLQQVQQQLPTLSL